jgi:hypothetical protein
MLEKNFMTLEVFFTTSNIVRNFCIPLSTIFILCTNCFINNFHTVYKIDLIVESTNPKQVYSVKLGFVSERTIFLDAPYEMMLFIGTRFSNLYTTVHTPA